MAQFIIGIIVVVFGVILTTVGGYVTKDGWDKMHHKDKNKKSVDVQQTMRDSPGGTQVVGDIYIDETENPLSKPIIVASASVEVRIKSDLDFNGRVANMTAYLGFIKGNKLLLKASSLGYTASQTGHGEVIYKGDLNTDSKDPSMGNPVSFLRDAEYIQIEFGSMTSNSHVLGGDVICTINNSIRLEFSIPPQTLVGNRVFVRDLSEALRVFNEPDM